MQFDLLSWGIGIPTGVVVNWLSIWLYQRCQRKRQAKGDYFTTNYSDGTFDFEGRVKTHISAEEVLENLLESLKREPKSGAGSTLGKEVMRVAKSHDTAARRIARILKGRYSPGKSPDVKGKLGRAEVKSKAGEIPTALLQLAGGSGSAFVALPKSEHKEALRRLKQRKTGLMNYQGKTIKPSTRK